MQWRQEQRYHKWSYSVLPRSPLIYP